MKFYILTIVVACSLYFFLKPSTSKNTTELADSIANQDVLAVKEVLDADNSNSSIVRTQDKTEKANLIHPEESAGQLGGQQMSSMLKQLAACTEIKNSVSESSVEPNLVAILDSVQSELGEPVIRSEDWNSTEIKLADNSRRLLRVETVYEDDNIIKKLRYYNVTTTQLEPIELTPEQSSNPSESFIASLEKEGELVSREKSERVFFQNGEEISYIEKNGRIQSSEIIRAGKSLKCSDYGQKSFRCQCF